MHYNTNKIASLKKVGQVANVTRMARQMWANDVIATYDKLRPFYERLLTETETKLDRKNLLSMLTDTSGQYITFMVTGTGFLLQPNDAEALGEIKTNDLLTGIKSTLNTDGKMKLFKYLWAEQNLDHARECQYRLLLPTSQMIG